VQNKSIFVKETGYPLSIHKNIDINSNAKCEDKTRIENQKNVEHNHKIHTIIIMNIQARSMEHGKNPCTQRSLQRNGRILIRQVL